VSSFFVGYGLGLVVAAQIGPVSLLIVRTVLRGNFAIGLAMGRRSGVRGEPLRPRSRQRR